MSTYREQSVAAKNRRRDPGTGDEVARGGPGKVRGDYVIEFYNPKPPLPAFEIRWCKWRSYRKRTQAEQALEGFRRKYPFWQWRLVEL